MKDAASGLPENAENGYFTKGAALALKAEVALHGASYIETGKEDYYKEVKTSSEELFKLGYSLDSDYKRCSMIMIMLQILRKLSLLCGEINQLHNIRILQCNNLHQMQRLMCCMTLHGLSLNRIFGLGNRWPSQDLVDEYEVIDRDGKAKKWNETSYYEDYINNPGTYWVSDHLYKHRDQRFMHQ